MAYNIDEDNIRTVVRVCSLYYLDGLNQAQIAKCIGISRPQVCRMLASAKASGIVNITINSPFSQEARLEQELKKRYSMQNVTVINSLQSGTFNVNAAAAVASSLNASLSDGDYLGVSPGTSVNSICDCLPDIKARHIRVVPLCGAVSLNKYSGQANLTAQGIAARIGGEPFQLYAPAFMSSETLRNSLMEEEYIRQVSGCWEKLSAALVGIGTLDSSATFIRSGLLQGEQIAELTGSGAAGGICNFFFDINGNIIKFSGHSRMIGISTHEFRSVPNRIAVAFGINKVNAILSSLRGGWINSLITSTETAEAVLERS